MYNKPFLKWVGGKHRVMNIITQYIHHGKRLFIPFAGSLALFLNTEFSEYYISDNNPDLINMYQTLVKHQEEFIHQTKELFIPDNNNGDSYYRLRKEFNTTQDTFRKSSLFIYLNRHCFNGLCRYNSKGEFNTPFGLYEKPYFPEKEMISFCEKVKRSQVVHFAVCDYMTALENVKSGDYVYCDPPAIERSPTARFANYHAVRFTSEDHAQLASLAYNLSQQGCSVAITNHNVNASRELYKFAHIEEYELSSLVSANVESRISVKELIAFFDSSLDLSKFK